MKMPMNLIAVIEIELTKLIINLVIITCESTFPIQNYASPT
jgi:hypothetical protein